MPTSGRDDNEDIYLINANSSGETRLTDGRHISFTADRDGNQETYVMSLDIGELTRLTNNPATDGGNGGVNRLPVRT